MMHLFLSAVDVWLFRDGRPFDAFSDHRAESCFPPYPSVVQGVIRSHHLVVKKVDLNDEAQIKAAVGTADDYKTLLMRGPFVAGYENGRLTRYLPIPADVVPQNGQFRPLQLVKPGPEIITSAPTPMLLMPPAGEPQKSSPGEWATEAEMIKCLKGESFEATPAAKLFTRETRLGIGRDDRRRTSNEGALYEVEFIRPAKNIGLYVEVDRYDGWPKDGLLRIGGEGRAARFEEVQNAPDWPQPPNPLPQCFKLFLATPACFDGGWRPKNWGDFFEGDVRLLAAALNRGESLGGFDWAKNEHKPARRFVPAGSVYYFESRDRARLKSGLLQNAVTHYGAEIRQLRRFVTDLAELQNAVTHYGAEIGFGQVLIEEYKQNV